MDLKDLQSVSTIVTVDWPNLRGLAREMFPNGGGLWRCGFQFKAVLRRRMAGFMVAGC